MTSNRHDPFRAQRETKRLEELPPIKPAFKTAERAHFDVWRQRLDREQRSLDADFERLFGGLPSDIPTPRNPINQEDGE